MKKLLLRGGVFSILLAASVLGCKKEKPQVAVNAVNEIKEEKITQPVKSENGVLIFENYAHLNQEIDKLSKLNSNERIALENKLGFQSLATIESKITESEIAHQEEFFKGVDPNLSVSEYESMNLFYENTSIFKENLEAGIIEKHVDKKGDISFCLSMKNAPYIFVLGADSKVIVGDELLVLNNLETKIYSVKTGELLRTSSVSFGTEKLNGEFDIDKGTYNTSTNSRWLTDPAKNSNYRYYANVIFTSNFTIEILNQTFYWTARAEQKKFGNWNTRNDYNPIYGISANWSYDYWIIYPGAGFGVKREGAQYPLANSAGNPTSSYNLSSLNSNYTIRNMYPNGFYSINTTTAGYKFFDNVRLYNYSFTFKFSGGSSGYNYNAI